MNLFNNPRPQSTKNMKTTVVMLIVKEHQNHSYMCFNFAVHFWAPTFKWGVSIANIIDSSKPPEQLSYVQQSEIFVIPILFSPALTCNGLIWARNSLIITPKNWNLFSVSIGMAATSMFQLSRKIQ
ncbi:Mitochondrial pyruvate carrier 2 [Prunus dulcis]|uniref:Mitochondrial pyruvate carrier n=1 Tax=Prunus dulcis TaxID=3755 RepID=A0A4Y1R6X7_PRUDU|nr:Mitochondrial pyruvate carrier 2 [Prunus dulcis]